MQNASTFLLIPGPISAQSHMRAGCEEVLLMMMYDLEKASKSASSISLYVSDNPEGSDEVLGPAGAVFPDQEARPVI